MRTKKGMCLLSLLAIVFLMIGCAAQPSKQLAPFQAQSLADGNWKQKADNLIFVLDASSSMTEGYNDVEKFAIGRGVIANFNQTMPNLNLQTALRSFGHDPGLSKKSTMLVYGVTNYNRAGLAEALNKIVPAGGPSPLEKSLAAIDEDMSTLKGKTAMVLVSDGKDMGTAPLGAANALKAKYGDRLCIYPVLVGDDVQGTALMKTLAETTGCGMAVTADQVASGPQMANFVQTVLLEAAPKPVAKPLPPMSDRKTWVFKDIKFEFDKATLMKSSYPVLDNIYEILNDHPEIKMVEIQGHTDSVGTDAYNMNLSQRRAQTVMQYLNAKGIAASRMTAKGYGESQPIDTNATDAGRANNRRVELKP